MLNGDYHNLPTGRKTAGLPGKLSRVPRRLIDSGEACGVASGSHWLQAEFNGGGNVGYRTEYGCTGKAPHNYTSLQPTQGHQKQPSTISGGIRDAFLMYQSTGT
jgi:hypothetical protein